MGLASVFINPQTTMLRGGWRALIFMAMTPQLLLSLLSSAERRRTGNVVEVGFELILLYGCYIGWITLVSWSCLRFLDRMDLNSLGFDFHPGWRRELLAGSSIGGLMVTAVVGLQAIGGGAQITPNPIWLRSGSIDSSGLLTVIGETLAALAFFIFAGAFEELVYRGYPFQTLLRSAPAILPISLFALLFGIGHWDNPNRSFFSTANTMLAGVWLSVAYLKTRSLWFTTALHFSWNWTMGAFFGLPVSGLMIPRHPVLVSTSQTPVWLTGGDYGCEGGAAATAALAIATIFIWRAKRRATETKREDETDENI
jgi:hypothetical protein